MHCGLGKNRKFWICSCNLFTLKKDGVNVLTFFLNEEIQNSLAVQWLRLIVFPAMGWGSGVKFPGQGTKIPQAVQHGQKK